MHRKEISFLDVWCDIGTFQLYRSHDCPKTSTFRSSSDWEGLLCQILYLKTKHLEGCNITTHKSRREQTAEKVWHDFLYNIIFLFGFLNSFKIVSFSSLLATWLFSFARFTSKPRATSNKTDSSTSHMSSCQNRAHLFSPNNLIKLWLPRISRPAPTITRLSSPEYHHDGRVVI